MKRTLSRRRHTPLARVAVRDLMSPSVETCTPTDDLNRVAGAMWDHDCGTLPVVDAAGRALGMITDRDVCMAAYTRGGNLSSIRVGDVMSKNVRAVRVDDTAGDALEAMRAWCLRRLPVLDARDRVVGLLSLADLAQRARRDRDGGADGTDFAEVGETLAAVCTPRRGRVGERALARRQSSDEEC